MRSEQDECRTDLINCTVRRDAADWEAADFKKGNCIKEMDLFKAVCVFSKKEDNEKSMRTK